MSCHRRNLEKMASRLSMIPSPLPPYSGLSYWANARNPFLSVPGGGLGCGVKLPNISVPLSILPLPVRSRTSHASPDPGDDHANLSAEPSPSRSKFTPSARLVKSNPLPATSIRIGEEQPVLLTVPSGLVNAALVVSGVVPQPPPEPVQSKHVSSQVLFVKFQNPPTPSHAALDCGRGRLHVFL